MGRTQNAVATAVAAVGELAELQRMWKQKAGLSYDGLAAATGISATTLRRAASGAVVPRQAVVLAAVTACGGPRDLATAAWKKARYQQRLADTPRRPAPALRLVRDEADLSAALVELYELAGAPSLALMEERAGKGRLGHSTAARIVSRQSLPADLAQLMAFLDAVELRMTSQRRRWIQAWHRVYAADAKLLPSPPRFVSQQAELRHALMELARAAGPDSVMEFERRGGASRGDVFDGLLANGRQGRVLLEKFLDACGVTRLDVRDQWRRAREMATRPTLPQAEVTEPFQVA